MFKNKTLMITGGTGSFGNVVLKRFIQTDIGEIRIFSRDEKKQDDMRHEFQAKMPEVADKIKLFRAERFPFHSSYLSSTSFTLSNVAAMLHTPRQ